MTLGPGSSCDWLGRPVRCSSICHKERPQPQPQFACGVGARGAGDGKQNTRIVVLPINPSCAQGQKSMAGRAGACNWQFGNWIARSIPNRVRLATHVHPSYRLHALQIVPSHLFLLTEHHHNANTRTDLLLRQSLPDGHLLEGVRRTDGIGSDSPTFHGATCLHAGAPKCKGHALSTFSIHCLPPFRGLAACTLSIMAREEHSVCVPVWLHGTGHTGFLLRPLVFPADPVVMG